MASTAFDIDSHWLVEIVAVHTAFGVDVDSLNLDIACAWEMPLSASHSNGAVPLAVAGNAVDKFHFEFQRPVAIATDSALLWEQSYGFDCNMVVALAALAALEEPVAWAACVDREQVRCFDDLALDN